MQSASRSKQKQTSRVSVTQSARMIPLLGLLLSDVFKKSVARISRSWINLISLIDKVRDISTYPLYYTYHAIFLELGVSATTAVWIRKEREDHHVPNGAASWIASGLRIVEEQ